MIINFNLLDYTITNERSITHMRISQSQLRKIIAETIYSTNLLREGDDPYPGMMPNEDLSHLINTLPDKLQTGALTDSIPTANGSMQLSNAIEAIILKIADMQPPPDEPLTRKMVFTHLQQLRKNQSFMIALSKAAERIEYFELSNMLQFIIALNQLMKRPIGGASVGQFAEIVQESFPKSKEK